MRKRRLAITGGAGTVGSQMLSFHPRRSSISSRWPSVVINPHGARVGDHRVVGGGGRVDDEVGASEELRERLTTGSRDVSEPGEDALGLVVGGRRRLGHLDAAVGADHDEIRERAPDVYANQYTHAASPCAVRRHPREGGRARVLYDHAPRLQRPALARPRDRARRLARVRGMDAGDSRGPLRIRGHRPTRHGCGVRGWPDPLLRGARAPLRRRGDRSRRHRCAAGRHGRVPAPQLVGERRARVGCLARRCRPRPDHPDARRTRGRPHRLLHRSAGVRRARGLPRRRSPCGPRGMRVRR